MIGRKIKTVCVRAATAEHPRISEGDLLRLEDGRWLVAYSDFYGGWGDHDAAQISASYSGDDGLTWSEPSVLQERTGRCNCMSVSLLRLADGSLALVYGEKHSTAELRFMLRRSLDEGESWGEPVQINTRSTYHVMNNARLVQLSSGRLIAPMAYYTDIDKDRRGRGVVYYSDDGGDSWQSCSEMIEIDSPAGVQEPGVVELSDGGLLMIIRTDLGWVYTCTSDNGGLSWSDPQRTNLASPQAPATITRIPATGHLLLVWNHNPLANLAGWKDRTPLTVAVSTDEGQSWRNARNLQDNPAESYAYTAVRFHADSAYFLYYRHRREEPPFRLTDLLLSIVDVSWFYGD